MSIDPAAPESVLALLLGLAFAGLVASAFEAAAGRPAGLALLRQGGRRAMASLPILAASAPFIILRHAIRGRRFERPRVAAVMASTVIACLWALMAGRLMLGLAHLLAAA